MAKIAVSAAGVVTLDGAVVSIDVLQTKLADLKQRSGVVWYYREAGMNDPPAQATEIIDLVIKSRLPISMSTKPDYSDVVMSDGTTKPRPGVTGH